MSKAAKYNDGKLAEGTITGDLLVPIVRAFQDQRGLAVDGMCGPNTLRSAERLLRLAEQPTAMAPAFIRVREWKPFDGPLDALPSNRREVYKVFGNPGTTRPDKAWVKKNIVTVRNLPGVPRKWYVKVHRLAEPYIREGLRRALIVAPAYKIERFASWVFRHIRFDTSRPLSMHSWGIAFDVDEHRNYIRQFKPRGSGPGAWTKEYHRIWPRGLPKPWVEAVQSVGFTWGSDWDNDGMSDDHTFYDPMHFELCSR